MSIQPERPWHPRVQLEAMWQQNFVDPIENFKDPS